MHYIKPFSSESATFHSEQFWIIFRGKQKMSSLQTTALISEDPVAVIITNQPESYSYKSSNGDFRYGLLRSWSERNNHEIFCKDCVSLSRNSCGADLSLTLKAYCCPCFVHQSTQDGLRRGNSCRCCLLSLAFSTIPIGVSLLKTANIEV